MSVGSTGDAVIQLQKRLNQLGLNIGSADGDYGQKTRAGVAEAQRLLAAAGYSLNITGEADAETLRLIFDIDAEAALMTLRKGSKGKRVRELQNRLIDLKLLEGAADGSYGSQTEAAVLLFQKKMIECGFTDLKENGIVSPETFQILMEDLNAYFISPLSYNEMQPQILTEEMLYSKACILIDAPSGEVLFVYNADEKMYPASTTKIMTLLLALENLDPNQQVTIPASAANIPADSSRVPVYPGEQMQIKDLIYGLMLRSGNDAANAIAEITAGSVDTFVELMNMRAEELNMGSTSFANPHGYHDENHYSTARDLATLTRYCLTNSSFCEFSTCLSYTMAETSKRAPLTLTNSYEIFQPSSQYYIEGAAGVKSGYTSHAGFCYVGAAQRDEKTLIAVILGVPGRNHGWTDLKRLFEYGFSR